MTSGKAGATRGQLRGGGQEGVVVPAACCAGSSESGVFGLDSQPLGAHVEQGQVLPLLSLCRHAEGDRKIPARKPQLQWSERLG